MTHRTPRIHDLTGGGGVPIHVRDWGPEDATPIVLIHGWSQHHMCWEAQTSSTLTDEFRLIAMDLRGHGASGKPEQPEAYADGALWAQDIHAILADLNLMKPVLVGWSYAGRVIGEYLTHHGDTALSAILLAGAVPASGAARPDFMMGPNSSGKDPDLSSEDQPRRIAATQRFVRACSFAPVEPDLEARIVAFNMLCPPHARRGLGRAASDTRPAYAQVRCPVTIVHGAEDRVVSPAAAENLAETVPHATKLIWDHCGHMPFIERADEFNALLRQIASTERRAA